VTGGYGWYEKDGYQLMTSDDLEASDNLNAGAAVDQSAETLSHFDEIGAFVAEFRGASSGVLHEIVSDRIHLDVLVFPPTDECDSWMFVTSGMSDLPMNVPDDIAPKEDYEHAELTIELPGDWFEPDERNMPSDAELRDPDKYWPIKLLKSLARVPHDSGSWLWMSHTVGSPHGSVEPYASNTKLSSALLAPVSGWPEERQVLITSDSRRINFFLVYPLYADELALKMKKGIDALVDALDAVGLSFILDVDRPNSVKRKGFLGFLR
jgi:hypothetical protein